MDTSFKHYVFPYLNILEIQNFQSCWHYQTSNMWNWFLVFSKWWILHISWRSPKYENISNSYYLKNVFEQLLTFWWIILDFWCLQIDRAFPLFLVNKREFTMVESWSATVPLGTSGVSLIPWIGSQSWDLGSLNCFKGPQDPLSNGVRDFFAGMFLLSFFVSIFSDFNTKKHPKMESKSTQNQWKMVSVAIFKKVSGNVPKIFDFFFYLSRGRCA